MGDQHMSKRVFVTIPPEEASKLEEAHMAHIQLTKKVISFPEFVRLLAIRGLSVPNGQLNNQ